MRIHLVEIESHLEQLGFLKSELGRIFGMEISVNERSLAVEQASFNRKRAKFDAEKILMQLRREFSQRREGKHMVLGLFPMDIYADSLNFIYGIGESNGNFGLISYFRLQPQFYGKAYDEKLFRKRLLKEAVHEIGHLIGIGHCKNKKCVMSFSPNILFVDRKGERFCESCELLV